jgi:hypothetical protein
VGIKLIIRREIGVVLVPDKTPSIAIPVIDACTSCVGIKSIDSAKMTNNLRLNKYYPQIFITKIYKCYVLYVE